MIQNLVSIIMPAFRAEACIAEAVLSLLVQTYAEWELILIADDKTDYRSVLLSSGINDSRIQYYSTDKVQSGPNVARNVGLKYARGEWIAPLDADDVYYPNRLTYLIGAASETGLALDNVNVVGDCVVNSLALNSPANTHFSLADVKSSLVPLLFLFHYRHIKQGWDEDVIRGADTLFNLRALESAGRAVYLSEALHEYRVHNQSMCHAEGSEGLFQQAYRYTLMRLRKDGLGFSDEKFRLQVIDMIEEKQMINQVFAEAVSDGFDGNYQSFVQAFPELVGEA